MSSSSPAEETRKFSLNPPAPAPNSEGSTTGRNLDRQLAVPTLLFPGTPDYLSLHVGHVGVAGVGNQACNVEVARTKELLPATLAGWIGTHDLAAVVTRVSVEREYQHWIVVGHRGDHPADADSYRRGKPEQRAGEGVEDAGGARVAFVAEEQEAVGGRDEDAVSERRDAAAEEAPGGRVDEEASVAALAVAVGSFLFEHDPLVREEGARVSGTRRALCSWIDGGGGAPAVADGAHLHVAVNVVGGQQAVADAADEVRGERRPVRRHDQSIDRCCRDRDPRLRFS
ncbi:hypothetical protein SEVIR_2G339250v4 [Setaria viridis]